MVYFWLTQYGDEEARNLIDFELLAPIPGLEQYVLSAGDPDQEMDDFMKTMAGMQ